MYTTPDFVNFQSKLIIGDLAIIDGDFNSQIYIGNEWNGKLVLESLDGWTRSIGKNICCVAHSKIMKNNHSQRPVLVTGSAAPLPVTNSGVVIHDGETDEESIDESVVKSLFYDVKADKSAFPVIDQQYHQLKINHTGLPRDVFSIIDVGGNTARLIIEPTNKRETARLISEQTSRDIEFRTYHAIHILQKEVYLWDYRSGFLKYLGIPEVSVYVNDKTFELLLNKYYEDRE